MKYRYNPITINLILIVILFFIIPAAIYAYQIKEYMIVCMVFVGVPLMFYSAGVFKSISFEITDDALIQILHPPFQKKQAVNKIYFKDIYAVMDDYMFNPNWSFLHSYTFFATGEGNKRIYIPGNIKGHQQLVSEVLKKIPNVRKIESFEKIYLWERKQSIDSGNISGSENFKYKNTHVILNLLAFPVALLLWLFVFYFIHPYIHGFINILLLFGSLCTFTLFYYALIVRYLITKFWYTDDAVFMRTFTKRGVSKFIYARWEEIIIIKNTGKQYVIQQHPHETIIIPYSVENHQELIKKILENKPKEAVVAGDFSAYK